LAKRPIREKKSRTSTYGIEDDSASSYYDPRNTRQFARQSAPLEAQTEAQGQYLSAIQTATLIFGVGPAGTGKTYCAAAYAAEQLVAKRIEQIIVTRPNVETGNPMGFIPGELEDKYKPFLAPFEKIMIERMGRGPYEYALASQKILPSPLAYMRGATFDNAIVILDEAQNTTPAEMKMFLTRIGKHCTVIVDGDIDQCDLSGPSGLQDAIQRLHSVDGVKVVEFTEDDIVRSGIVKSILKAYRR
jgi:phosphate starvation-inducible PhoH-like protein